MNERIANLAEGLRRADVSAAFGVPGSGLSWQLLSALADRGAPFHGVTHEAAGAIMAGAYARISRSIGCAISIKGPGLANLLPGMLSNAYEHWPVVSVSEAYGPATPPSRMHKRLDQSALVTPIAKAYATLGDPEETAASLARLAREESPGPVHLDLFVESAPPVLPRPPRDDAGDGERGARDTVWRLASGARRPVVIVGSLATRSPWLAALSTLRVPVFTTVAAKGVLDERSSWAAGVFTGDGKSLTPECRILPEADLVIGLGLRNLEVLSPRPFASSSVLLDCIGEDAMAGFAATAAHAHAAPEDFERMLAYLAGVTWGEDLVAESVASLRERLIGAEWLPGRLYDELQRMLPDTARLVADTGLFCTVAEHVWRAPVSERFVASANGRFMGTGVPMAIGAALADRESPVVCAVGDGGIAMYAAELKLAVSERLPIVFVLMSDGRYGSIASAASSPGLLLDAVTMAQPSWYRAAAAIGCESAQATTLEASLDAVGSWRSSSGPLFVEAVFDPAPYAAMTANVR